MELAVVLELVEAVAVLDDQAASRDDLCAATDRLRRLQSWVQAQQMRIARGMARVSSFPEQSLSQAGMVGLAQASRLLERTTTATQAPALAAAVENGLVSGEHVDALTRALRTVEPDARDQLIERAEQLVPLAASQTADEFAKRLRAEARRLQHDDGISGLERQRRATSLTTWIDVESGMWCMRGAFDPVTGLTLSRIVDAALAQQFAKPVPAGCPSDPVAKQGYLRAMGLVSLLECPSGGAQVTVPEAILVLHAAPDGSVVIDPGLPVDVPRSHLERIAARSKVFPVIVRDGDVVAAPGERDLGRTRRLASGDQRRMLRALYSTCFVDRCAVPFDQCEAHHIIEFDDGGPTDLSNLIPSCAHHHDRLHAERWKLSVGPGRVVTVTLPDRRLLTCPPNRAGP